MIRTSELALDVVTRPAYAGRHAALKTLNPKSLADGQSHSVLFGADKIHYVTLGEGKHTLVFVHCWAGNLGFWREQVPALADKARLVLMDLPGHGQSGRRHTVYNMDYFAGAVRAVMCDARVDKATLVGHSMGGPVIYRVYEQAPKQVAALVVVDGFLRRPRVTSDQAEEFIARFRTPEYREHTRQFFGSMFPVPGTEALRDRILSELLATPQRVMHRAMEGMFGPGQPAWDLKAANVPVLVINAKGAMWEADDEKYIRSLSTQTDYRVMDSVGHWLMLERPVEFNALLTDMLRKFKLIAR
ncbi:MAG: alpha/beta fold hydrolase [Verrucomicrobiia bacterium]